MAAKTILGKGDPGVVKICDSDKAPAPDSFTNGFFKSRWHTIKSDLLNALNHFHEVNISHILYADDTLLFCNTMEHQMMILWLIFNAFEAVSDLHINYSKSSIFPVNQGGITLINSFLDALPTYTMSLFPTRPPTYGSNNSRDLSSMMDKLRRDFLCNGNKQNNSFCLVKWDKVPRTERRGVLGSRTSNAMMEVLLKQHWRFNKEENALWRRLFIEKFSLRNSWFTKEPKACMEQDPGNIFALMTIILKNQI
ncbi:hypothetical protein H5410_062328 [Solanum commersonii]|uniref:Reverse transcriptase domain-containing protein n=1 Tax=Solanum commersonii TaxID=4109 RepID=A0A9J5WAK5_SOLCO|nr:hypothetical protein H5410_062328 [Solanum commersonii]